MNALWQMKVMANISRAVVVGVGVCAVMVPLRFLHVNVDLKGVLFGLVVAGLWVGIGSRWVRDVLLSKP